MFYTIFFIFLKETWRCSGARTVYQTARLEVLHMAAIFGNTCNILLKASRKISFFSWGDLSDQEKKTYLMNSLRSELLPHVCVNRCRCLVCPRFDSSSAAFPWGLWLFSWVWVAFLQVHRVDRGAKLAPGVSWWLLRCVFLPLTALD